MRTEKRCYQSQLFTLQWVSSVVYSKRPIFSSIRVEKNTTNAFAFTLIHAAGNLASFLWSWHLKGLCPCVPHRCGEKK